jgi:hypothetical protein
MNGNAIRGISALIPVSGSSWVVRNLSSGTGINITNDGAGTYNIASVQFTEEKRFCILTGTLVANTLLTFTLPSGVNLVDYDMRVKLHMTLANNEAQNTYTFFSIRYNSVFSGKMIWTNSIHTDTDFGQAGAYPQNYLYPYFAYVNSYNSVSTVQGINTDFEISKSNHPTWEYSPIMTRFNSIISATNSGPTSSDYRFQEQIGHIQSAGNGSTLISTISTIGIGQAGGVGRNGLGGVPCELTVWLKRKT